ncbi:MAG: TRC40/GET3/ArsA family transport-energizing ATPase [Deltaproteobacteria bacterium]|nr:TRC40/GET3/ArsA family transport-energizing ATPase [Deltaproteobacteria bacterium]
MPEFLQNKDLRLIIFGGKGGVGKTTMAAAAALRLTDVYQGRKKILIISTDPAHSLSDSFGVEIGDRVTAIQGAGGRGRNAEGRGQSAEGGTRRADQNAGQSSITNHQSPIKGLFAMELDAARLLEEFKETHGETIRELAHRGTYFDQEDIASFLELSLPGMDEVMAVLHVADLLQENAYDVLILDTAPTGHTIRMLELPEQMKQWIHLMDLMEQKYRYMATRLTGRKIQDDACDRFVRDLSRDIDAELKLLKNDQITRFVPVSIPEPMVVNETKRLHEKLMSLRVPVHEIIVNRVAPQHGCAVCQVRHAAQAPALTQMRETFPDQTLIQVPLLAGEIYGISGLQALADYLAGGTLPPVPATVDVQEHGPTAALKWRPGLECYLFGGKGGVGKTTLAAATAVYLAGVYRDKKILLFSTDPAHSLSDALNQPIGDEITAVQEAAGRGQNAEGGGRKAGPSDLGPQTSDINLFALEINSNQLFEQYKTAFEQEIQGVFDRFVGTGMDVKFDREIMTQLLSLAPPGLDEIMALDRIMDLKAENAFEIFVLDTSPTGHLLRFLALPHMIREWLNAFFRLLMKYKGVVPLSGMAEKALSLSKNVRRIQETLTDADKTGFAAVTIAEAMGVSEVKRLMAALENAGILCENIAINQVTPPSSCPFCEVRRGMEQTRIGEIIKAFPAIRVAEVPLFEKALQGVEDLKRLGHSLFGSQDHSF